MEILDNLPFLLKKQDKNKQLGSSGKYRERAIFSIRNQQVKSSSLLAGSINLRGLDENLAPFFCTKLHQIEALHHERDCNASDNFVYSVM